ncbi:hypothetical protein DFH09DRAFT_1139882, partial [Mycena vulgaris]
MIFPLGAITWFILHTNRGDILPGQEAGACYAFVIGRAYPQSLAFSRLLALYVGGRHGQTRTRTFSVVLNLYPAP